MCARLGWVRRAIAAALVVAAAAVFLLTRGGDEAPEGVPFVPTPPGEVQTDAPPLPDPFAWAPDRAAQFERRAAAGNSHPLYALSPGGAIASAERTARWRPQVERAAARGRGRPRHARGRSSSSRAPAARTPAPRAAWSRRAGLTQILAETAQNLLGMEVDLAASERITRRLARAERRGDDQRAIELRRARAQVDQRFDGAQALAGTARYLALARDRFRREDLAFVSYHMGIGNLESVLRDFAGAGGGRDRRAGRGRGPDVHEGVLRLDAAAPSGGLRAADRARRRLLELPLEGRGGARDHAALPRGPRRADAAGDAARGQGLGRGGPAPARGHDGLRAPARTCGGRGTAATSCRSRPRRR